MKYKIHFNQSMYGYLFVVSAILVGQIAAAKENIGKAPKSKSDRIEIFGKTAGCAASTAQRDLEVNNVRTTILNGGDMWWNLSNARYEIPKVIPGTGQVSKHSLFSGALWIGGVTNGNLRLAAQTYRQSGNDFFPGPLTIGSASVSATVCSEYDKIWKVTLTEIDKFRKGELGNLDNASEDLINWPAEIKKPGAGYARYLAPFLDYNGDGEYNPSDGDYPSFDQNSIVNIPDMMLFFVANDKGNIHSETQGIPIGLELQTTAFGYSTNDEVNNMTFYRTVIHNRSNEVIDSCVFGQWVDADLGNYQDDYVECDVTRNLGICYNGDDNDEGVLGYGLNPPSIGVNFFEGPRRPDSSEIGLTKFVYYDNDFSLKGNPTLPEHFWNYLNGRWKDGIPLKYGGNGKDGGNGLTNDTSSYMFPGTTYPYAKRELWTERTAGNTAADRRFLQTAGSFSLLPGAVNKVTIGVVWARASSGGSTGSFNLLKQASDKAFVLFKNNFKIIAGPESPLLLITELDRNLIVKLTKTEGIENYLDSFAGPCGFRTRYRFQGYQIYQLKTANIPSDIYDVDQARLVAQFDVKDGVTQIVNGIFDPDLEENVKKIMVRGTDGGIQHSFQITKDLFESGSDQTLVNFKDYHYAIISYASAENCVTDPTQYLQGRKTIGSNSVLVYTVTPHDPLARNGGTKVNAKYGDGFPITRVEGTGNGANNLAFTPETLAEILTGPNYYIKNPTYAAGSGPIKVKIVDPLKVPNGDFIIYMRDTSVGGKKTDSLRAAATHWYMNYNGTIVKALFDISRPYEQLFPEWGMSVDISQCIMPGERDNLFDPSNGYLFSSITRANPADEWLDNIKDESPQNSGWAARYGPQFNWIRAGNFGAGDYNDPELDDYAYPATAGNPPVGAKAVDPRKGFSKVIEGTWSPYALATSWRTRSATKLPTFGPAWDGVPTGQVGSGLYRNENNLNQLQSVDVVLTSDKSLWSRCIVVEGGEDPKFNLNGADKMDLRKSPSVDKNGKTGDGIVTSDPTDADYISSTGMGWFPGYAVNLETGERLNVMFAEDSSLPGENGQDMIWNPTDNILDPRSGRPVFGGKHYIYIMGAREVVLGSSPASPRFTGPRYDAGAAYRLLMDSVGAPGAQGYIVRKRLFYGLPLWTSMPVMRTGYKMRSAEAGLISSQVTFKIRVKRPYASYSNGGATINDSMPYYTFSTKGFAPDISKEVAKKALDKVNIVPNPYYAYSSYESNGNQLDNQVRLVNLPAKCVVKIFTMEGVLVRTIRKDDENAPYTIWDLKNDAQVPISSGVYLIHVNATELGEERIIKWFGVMRQIDFDTF